MVGVMAQAQFQGPTWEEFKAKQKAMDEAVQRTVQRTEEERVRRATQDPTLTAKYQGPTWDERVRRAAQYSGDICAPDEAARRATRYEAAMEEAVRGDLQQMTRQQDYSDEFLLALKKYGPPTVIPPEGVKVSTVDAQLKQKLQERRDEREVAARLALVDAYGEDVYPVGTVITFEKVHNVSRNHPYSYAALKTEDERWYTTGAANNAAIHTWDSLVEFLVSGPKPVKNFILKAEGGTEVPLHLPDPVTKS